MQRSQITGRAKARIKRIVIGAYCRGWLTLDVTQRLITRLGLEND